MQGWFRALDNCQEERSWLQMPSQGRLFALSFENLPAHHSYIFGCFFHMRGGRFEHTCSLWVGVTEIELRIHLVWLFLLLVPAWTGGGYEVPICFDPASLK